MNGIRQMYDKIIIGAGLYGLYAALYCAKKGQNVLVIEREQGPFMRATYINQARVHMGYHYPRSIYTAMKSAHYFNRFNEDFVSTADLTRFMLRLQIFHGQQLMNLSFFAGMSVFLVRRFRSESILTIMCVMERF